MTEGTDAAKWLARQQQVQHPVTAVKVLCAHRGHLVASIHPVPAAGTAVEMAVWLRPARYRRDMATYLAPAEPTALARWVTLDHRAQIHDFEAFDRGDWSQSATWARRCGLGTLAPNIAISAAYAWGADRRQAQGKLTIEPRVVMLV